VATTATPATATPAWATVLTEDHVADPVADRTEAGIEDHLADPVADAQDDDEAEDAHDLLPARDSGGRGAVGSYAGVVADVRVGERLWHAWLLCHLSVACVTAVQIAESTGTVIRIDHEGEWTVRQF
jgi:hypothetical protein